MAGEEQEVSQSLPGELGSHHGGEAAAVGVGLDLHQRDLAQGRQSQAAQASRLDRVRESLHRGRVELPHANLRAAGIDGQIRRVDYCPTDRAGGLPVAKRTGNTLAQQTEHYTRESTNLTISEVDTKLPQHGASGSIKRSCYAIRDVPRLAVSKRLRIPPPNHDPSKEYRFRYHAKKHSSLPHVVKFSGGRSSGMLLFVLLENGLLDASRGDVIVFNNTSAEHPDTYRFVRDCMHTAYRYGIPFFQLEFQTYEDARQGEWTRLPTYRLVNGRPKSATNTEGFHWRGEVFEELLSWAGYVPNQFNRICTKHLKLDVTRSFLKDWFASKATIPRLGHYGNHSRMDPDAAFRRHRQNQGGVPEEIFLRKRAYAWSRPHVRPGQRYDDFHPGWQPFENKALKGKTFGDKACFGNEGVEYVAFIGLRGDEPHRIRRVEARNDTDAGYEGEHVYMPLNDMAVTRDDVNAFWERQSWDLELPEDTRLSNCVYCFLKGAANLEAIHAELDGARDSEVPGFGPLANTPCDLRWWMRIEALYGRDLRAEKRTIRRKGATHIGFFGNHPFAYGDLASGRNLGVLSETLLPCDCTE